MNELIKITETDGKKTVSARELHQKLQVKAKFSDWIKRMIEYGFEENKDYTTVKLLTEVILKNEKNLGGRPEKEYYVSLDMAKEICMIQRSEIGRTFRQYFIECEKELKNIVTKVEYITQKSERELNVEEAHILENLIPLCPVETYKQILASHITKKVTGEFLLPLPQRKEEYYRATEIGKELGISKKQVGQIAEKYGLKTEEYGEKIWDRANNGKQVPGFVYNSKGREKIKELYYADKNNKVS